jgi:hypothetical protein
MADKTIRFLDLSSNTNVDVAKRDNGDGSYSESMALRADARTTKLKSLKVTLSGTAGEVTTVNLPAGARGFRLYPAAADVRFAVDENPVAEQTSTAAAVASTAFGAGGIAKAAQWETRLLETTYTSLRMLSTSSSAVVEVEVF